MNRAAIDNENRLRMKLRTVQQLVITHEADIIPIDNMHPVPAS